MSEPLAGCCNGCDAPPHYPSDVLCVDCLRKLGERIDRIQGFLQSQRARPVEAATTNRTNDEHGVYLSAGITCTRCGSVAAEGWVRDDEPLACMCKGHVRCDANGCVVVVEEND